MRTVRVQRSTFQGQRAHESTDAVRQGVLAVMVCAILCAGCAESVLIKSYPAGAKAYLDDQYIGTTPAYSEIPRSEVSEQHTYRVSHRDCDPAEGNLQTAIAGGRVAGYIFTVGLTAIFQGPRYFLPVDVELLGGGCEPPMPVTKSEVPTGITVQQIVGDQNVLPGGGGGTNLSKTQKLAERLSTLRDLYVRKLIPKEVYERERDKAIEELTR